MIIRLLFLLLFVALVGCENKEKDWKYLAIKFFAQKTNYITENEIKNILADEFYGQDIVVEDVLEERYLSNITTDYALVDTFSREFLFVSSKGDAIDSSLVERLRIRLDEYIVNSFFSDESIHNIEITPEGLLFRVDLEMNMPSDKLYTFLEARQL